MHTTSGDEGCLTDCQACGSSVSWQVSAQSAIVQLVGQDQRLGATLSWVQWSCFIWWCRAWRVVLAERRR